MSQGRHRVGRLRCNLQMLLMLRRSVSHRRPFALRRRGFPSLDVLLRRRDRRGLRLCKHRWQVQA